MTITRINPDSLHKNPVFTQVATVGAAAKLIFVGGQNGVTRDGKIAGSDIASQSVQAYKNVAAALEAAGASFADVFKMNVYLVQGHTVNEAFGAIQRSLQIHSEPPTVSVLIVAGLANPEYLIEIEAVAAVAGEA